MMLSGGFAGAVPYWHLGVLVFTTSLCIGDEGVVMLLD
jgi:hypothetical protein